MSGRDGKYVTDRQIRERLDRELIHNVALRVEDTEDPDRFLVSGRGELHLAILIENMRREGYEIAIGRPQVIVRDNDGTREEPYEQLTVDVENDTQGAVMELLGERRGEMQDMTSDGRVPPQYRLHHSSARPDRLQNGLFNGDGRYRFVVPLVQPLWTHQRWPNCDASQRRTHFNGDR